MVGISNICCVETRRVSTSCVAALTLLQACTSGAEPPPHPPPHPTLDIIVEGTQVHVNGRTLDATRVSNAEVAQAFEGLAPNAAGGGRSSTGAEIQIENGRIRSLSITFTPNNMTKGQGTAAFTGRLIVNGAWIHEDAEIYHIEKELGEPCLDHGQGAGRFRDHRSWLDPDPAHYWTCEVGGQSYLYELERYPNEEHPLFSFRVAFNESPFPPLEPPAEPKWWDVVTLPWFMLLAVFEFVSDIFDADAPSASETARPSASETPSPPASHLER